MDLAKAKNMAAQVIHRAWEEATKNDEDHLATLIAEAGMLVQSMSNEIDSLRASEVLKRTFRD